MTERNEDRALSDQPEVEPETIADLDATPEEADGVRGGVCASPARAATAQTKTL